MASSCRAAAILILVVAAQVAAGAAVTTTTHLRMFLHNIVEGSEATAVMVVKGPVDSPTGMSFGDTTVVDDLLTETSSRTSAAVGRMQGFFFGTSLTGPVLTVTANIVLTAGEHNGSTIAVTGRLDDTVAAITDASVRELAVVGGTGKFRKATGYVLWEITRMIGRDAIIELNVYASTSAEDGPVSA